MNKSYGIPHSEVEEKRKSWESEKKETVKEEENQGSVASWKPPSEERASRWSMTETEY